MDVDLGAKLAQVARDVQAGWSAEDAAETMAYATRDLIPGAHGAGITLLHGRSRIETAAATSAPVRAADELQYELAEGPCWDSAFGEVQVHSDDIAHDPRWPQWGPRVAEQYGIRSMLCTHLFRHQDQDRLGALNVYSRTPEAFGPDERDLAVALAAHGALALAGSQLIEGLRFAVDRRTTIGKAIGLMMGRYGLDDHQALAVLRRLSQDGNRKLYDLAQHIVLHRVIPSEDDHGAMPAAAADAAESGHEPDPTAP